MDLKQVNNPTTLAIHSHVILTYCCILTFDPAKNAIQSDAQVSSADYMGQGEGPTSE